MIEHRFASSSGRWLILARDGTAASAAIGFAAAHEAGATPTAGPVDFGGEPAWIKGGPLAPSGSRRHALRAALPGAPTPRRREFTNLTWLARRLFRTPEPLAALTLLAGRKPRAEWLATGRIGGARTLHAFLTATRGPECATEREAVLVELAREVARMHALAFVHRDLFPRNILVAPPDLGRRLVFLDCWRGGERLQLRGPAYDLACLFLHLDEVASREEQSALLARYGSERAIQGRPVDLDRLWRRALRERRALVRRLAREPRRLGGRPLPPPTLELPPPPSPQAR